MPAIRRQNDGCQHDSSSEYTDGEVCVERAGRVAQAERFGLRGAHGRRAFASIFVLQPTCPDGAT